MQRISSGTRGTREFGRATQALASMCHGCAICPYAERRPHSALGRVMRWHRTWCPGWASHTKVYGPKTLS